MYRAFCIGIRLTYSVPEVAARHRYLYLTDTHKGKVTELGMLALLSFLLIDRLIKNNTGYFIGKCQKKIGVVFRT